MHLWNDSKPKISHRNREDTGNIHNKRSEEIMLYLAKFSRKIDKRYKWAIHRKGNTCQKTYSQSH